MGERDFASSQEFAGCFETLFFWTGIASFASLTTGGRETHRVFSRGILPFRAGFLTPFFGRGLRRLASVIDTVNRNRVYFASFSRSLPACFDSFFWTEIASLVGFFWGARDFASSHEFAGCFDSFLWTGIASFGFFLWGRETFRLLTSLPTVLTPFFWTGIASFGFRCYSWFGFFLGARDFAFFAASFDTFSPSFGFFLWARDFPSSREFADCFGRGLRR